MKEYLIFWSPLSEETYLKTLTAFAHNQKKNLRRCLITPQTSLVYQFVDDVIELVAFFDNRSSHDY